MRSIYDRISLAWKLGYRLPDKLKFELISFWLPITRKLKLYVPPEGYSVKLAYNNQPFTFCVTDGSDLGVLREIFLEQQYSIEYKDPKHIMDLGGNVGASAIYFALMYPKADIAVFKPHPATYKKLLKNCVDFPLIHTYNYAVANNKGCLSLYPYKGSSMSSSLFQREKGDDGIKVNVLDLDGAIRKTSFSHIDLLKFDVEGSEFDIFQNQMPSNKIAHLVGEVHEDIGNFSLMEFLNLFPEYKLVQQKKLKIGRFLVEFSK